MGPLMGVLLDNNPGVLGHQYVFASVAAFGTVGLSRGITPDLTDPGKITITIAMFIGRLGPLTIALGLALRERRAVYRFAQERVHIG